ncbi:MAG: ATP phosphoribosyltransferase regulatory subunit [Actinomycetota bacterium]|nr:ATP phosphoribosyltransferase regulatory subunit [Actinomycetota bacterium]
MVINQFLGQKDKHKTRVFMSLIKPQQNLEHLKQALAQVNLGKAIRGLDYLKQVYKVLEQVGYGQNLLIDLSILREFDYYSGLLFEVYSAVTTDLLGNGGRYDRLIKKFGMGVAATGFALDLDMLHKSMDSSILLPYMDDYRVLLAGKVHDYAAFVQLSDKMRKSGACVELFWGKDREAEAEARSRDMDLVCICSEDLQKVEAVEVDGGRKFEMKTDKFLKYIDEKTNT